MAQQSSQSDYNTALTVTENILTANPGLDAIFAANEPGVLGAAEAVRQAGKKGEITIVGWDGNPKEVEALRDGLVSALVVQNPFRMGYDGVNASLEIIRKGETVQGEDTGVSFVTNENVDDPKSSPCSTRAARTPRCRENERRGALPLPSAGSAYPPSVPSASKRMGRGPSSTVRPSSSTSRSSASDTQILPAP